MKRIILIIALFGCRALHAQSACDLALKFLRDSTVMLSATKDTMSIDIKSVRWVKVQGVVFEILRDAKGVPIILVQKSPFIIPKNQP